VIYRLLRWIAGIALYWFYREIRVVGREKIPATGPLLIAVNHQNALVDSLIIGRVAPRKITMTAKATLIENPLIAALFKMVGVVPLRRVSDESQKSGSMNRSRNANAFRELLETLRYGGAVLIFPEGKSHNETGLEPLRTGLARLALQARTEAQIGGVHILPIGLIFEDKSTPGSVVGVRIGDTIDIDSWSGHSAASLTEEIARRLRNVSEEGDLPGPAPDTDQYQRIPSRVFIGMAAAWGHFTHRMPIRMARALALRQGGDADQPAMLTMMFGITLVLLTYVIQIAVVGALLHSFWISCLYLASLLTGAYWAAFEKHPRHY
jgi:1-acyl-sn-glycerol-3-phosphate acyltransferase